MQFDAVYRLVAALLMIEIICLMGYWQVGQDLKYQARGSEHHVVHRIKKAKTELPGGGRTFDGKRLVALYGTPDNPALGVLGEQPAPGAIDRVIALAQQYQPHAGTDKVIPAFEIITTVASEWPTDNNDYSMEVNPAVLLPWVKQAQARGVYVILDLQPGRGDFLSQAMLYKELLKYPNVGLALDPEWRLPPNVVPMEIIGTVDAAEVNQVAEWLAALTRKHRLPQKVFLLHQFRLDMITNRHAINTNYKELLTVIQMDGNGDQPQKQDTWNYITAEPPANTRFGWKNFIDEDSPTLDPAGTMSKTPAPFFVSYQ